MDHITLYQEYLDYVLNVAVPHNRTTSSAEMLTSRFFFSRASPDLDTSRIRDTYVTTICWCWRHPEALLSS